MTSKLTLYKSEIVPERNALIEDIAQYLDEKAIKTYEADNFQYQKIAINTVITIAADQSNVGNQNLGNYCKIEQDNRAYYYFITNVEWTSSKAVKLTLSLDTINTYAKDLHFDERTTIQREHQDRFKKYVNADTLPGEKSVRRNIDKIPENIILPKIMTSAKKILDNQSDFNWYLVYKTRDDLTPENTANPIECGLIADEPLLIKAEGMDLPPFEFKPIMLNENDYVYLTEVNSPHWRWHNDVREYRSEEFPTSILAIHKNGDRFNIDTLKYRKNSNDAYEFLSKETFFTDKIVFTQSTTLPKTNGLTTGWFDIVKSGNRLNITTGRQERVITEAFEEVDKTDSKLMKIIRLPYCPVSYNINNKGEYEFGSEWKYENGRMKLTTNNLSSEFLNWVDTIDISKYLLKKVNVGPNTAKDIRDESKLYNSELFTYKGVYDNFFKEIKLENFVFADTYDGSPIEIPLYFKPTNTVNSNFAFRFDTEANNDIGYNKESDYEDYLLVTRNNEETIFSNDYINYIRNGYNFDKKAKYASLGQNIFGIFSGLAQTGVTVLAQRSQAGKEFDRSNQYADLFGFKNENRQRFIGENTSAFLSAAAISSGFGAVNGIVNTIVSDVNAQKSIDAKLQQLSQQSTSVSGADDVDLLQYYNGNRLTMMTYLPKEQQQKNIYNLFFLTGYSHPIQELPNTNSRYWFNYIQCLPIFVNEHTSVYSDYLDDIRVRFGNGITVYHHHPETVDGWDLEQQYENWETSLLNTDHYKKDGIKFGSINQNNVLFFSYEPGYGFNPATEEIEFEYTDTNGEVVSRYVEGQTTTITLLDLDKSEPIFVSRRMLNYDIGSPYRKIN